MGQASDELKRDIDRTREDLGETLEAIGDRVTPRGIVQRQQRRARTRLTAAKERVFGSDHDPGLTGRAAGSVGHAAEQAGDAVKAVPDAVTHRTQGSPMGAGLVAYGLGMLTASLLPPTRTEREMAAGAREQLEPVTRQLSDAGREVLSEVQDEAREAAHAVQERSRESAEAVKGEIREERAARSS